MGSVRYPLRNMLSRMYVFSNWYSIELTYSGLRKPIIDVKTWQGLHIHIKERGDLAVLDEVFCNRAYDQERARLSSSHNNAREARALSNLEWTTIKICVIVIVR